MSIRVTMPALSPTMEEGLIAKWLVKEGDKIEDGDPICEIATDKSTIEFQAVDGGFLKHISVKEGESARVNDLIAVICETMDEDISSILEESTIQETPKVEEHDAQEKTEVKETAQVTGGLNVMSFSPPPAKTESRQKVQPSLHASPLAKKIAKEQGLDISSVKGSGPNGRVVAKDLEQASASTIVKTKKGSFEFPDGSFEEIALTPVRKIIGERLQASKMTIPHYVISQKVDMGRVMELRSELKELGVKLTFNDFVVKAVSLALVKHPEINTGFDSKNNTIIQYKTVDISVAVSVPDGLITPIIWQADYLSIEEISFETKKLVKLAKEGALQADQYQGGSFTISNLGMFGVTDFQAVINPPQAAILAVAGINEEVKVESGEISTTSFMNLSISLDHRVIDGAQGAQFINSVKFFLENPSSLIM